MRYDYGLLNAFIGMGAIAMTGFFMLSGYSLYISSHRKNFNDIKEIKAFYIKRFISVFPIYYVTAILYVTFIGKESLIENILLAPISFLGLQSIYSGTFSISHVSGTWFISCITLCYLAYPYLQNVIRQLDYRASCIMIGMCTFILLYSPIFQSGLQLPSIYENPLVRLLEFTIGILIVNFNFKYRTKLINFLQSKTSLIIGVLGMFLFVNLGIYLHIASRFYMLYDWIVLPTFIMIIMPLGKLNFSKISRNKTILYLSAISYDFFLAQFFLWDISRWIFRNCGIESNLLKITISLALCFAIAICMHEIIEKPVGRWLKLKLLTQPLKDNKTLKDDQYPASQQTI